MQESICLVVSENEAGLRLDRFINHHFPEESRSRIQQWIEQGCVQQSADTNNSVQQSSYKVKSNERLIVTPPQANETDIVPQDIPLNIVFEDDDLIVINKPAGLVVHPAPGHWDNTLVNALLAHCGSSLSGIGGVKRPGIVHRLDKDTSGLLVVAKNDQAHNGLSAQFHQGSMGESKTLCRRYKTIVFGKPAKQKVSIETFIGRHPKNRQKMTVLKHGGGKRALTHIHVDSSWTLDAIAHTISVLDCHLETGRTHQIRVHCQSMGCYVLGDPLYGKRQLQNLKNMPEVIKVFDRQALHAYHLSFIHPISGKSYDFWCELPEDMESILALLKSSATQV